MAWTQADIDALDDALKDPSLEVTFSDGRKHKYRSVEEISMARSIGLRTLNAGASRYSLADFRETGNEYSEKA